MFILKIRKFLTGLFIGKLAISAVIGLAVISCGGKKDSFVHSLKDKFSSSKKLNEKRSGGLVAKVYDGDTVTLANGTKIRFYGIDAPELHQKGGKFARDSLCKKICDKKIEYEPISTDRYGRTVAKVYYNGEYINQYMVASGSAWYYEQYAKDAYDLKSAFDNARAKRIGIFKDYNIEMPSEYRKSHKK